MSADVTKADQPREAAKPRLGRILQDSSWYLVGNVASRAVGFLAIPFYARFLTPAQYGLIELIELSTQTVAIAFGLQAIGAALSRLFHDQRDEESARAVVSTSLILTGMLSCFVTIVAVACARPLCILVFKDDTWAGLLQAAFVAMFFGNMIEVVLVYERIRDNARFFLGYTLVTLFVTLGLNVVFIGFLDAGVWGFVSSKLVVTAVSCVFLGMRMRRDVGWRWRWAFAPELVRFGAPLVLSSLSYFAIHFSDRFFLSANVSLAELGRYALAYKFAILVSALVGDSFAKSWNVTLYRYVDQPGWQAKFAQVGAYFTYVLFATGLAIALFSPELLRLMVPTDYFPPAYLLPIVIASYLAREIGDFFRALMLINKRSALVGNVALGGAAANIALNALLIPTYGIYGAAVSTFLTWFAYMIVCWAVSNAEHRLPINPWAYARITALLVAVYTLATETRVDFLPAQAALDLFWSMLFCVSALWVFLSAVERWGLLCFAAKLFVWFASLRQGPRMQATAGLRLLIIGDERQSGNDRDASLADRLGGSGMDVIAVTRLAAARTRKEAKGLVAVRRACGSEAAQQFTYAASALPARVCGMALRGIGVFLLPKGSWLAWAPLGFEVALRYAGAGTTLLSSRGGWAAHLAAAAVKQRTGVPWVADLRAEELADCKGAPGGMVARLAQQAVAENADAAIVGSDAAMRRLLKRYPDAAILVHVVGARAEESAGGAGETWALARIVGKPGDTLEPGGAVPDWQTPIIENV